MRESVPGEVVRAESGIELVWVGPGRFKMGADNISSDERPTHWVTIGRGFYMGKYEVTIGQWRKVMGDLPARMKEGLEEKFKSSDDLPVMRVSWDNAQEFIKRLNERDKLYVYRLPTEAEWEYACRAGTTGDYHGDLKDVAWYEDNSRGSTHLVGTQQPNAFGLYDMHGNVFEWCLDINHQNYNGAPADGSAWITGKEVGRHILRGGSWSKGASELRSAQRRGADAEYNSENIGFRVVAVARQ